MGEKLKSQIWYYAIVSLVILLATPTIQGLLMRWLPFMVGPILSWIMSFLALFITLIPTDMLARRFLKI